MPRRRPGGPKRIVNKRNGRVAWDFRYTHPITGNPTHKRIYIGEKREAGRGFRNHMDKLESSKVGRRRVVRLSVIDTYLDGGCNDAKA